MTINPKWGMWISIIAALLMFLAGASAELTTLFTAGIANKIVAWAVFLGGAINALNAILHMIPSVPGAAGANQFPLGPSK